LASCDIRRIALRILYVLRRLNLGRTKASCEGNMESRTCLRIKPCNPSSLKILTALIVLFFSCQTNAHAEFDASPILAQTSSIMTQHRSLNTIQKGIPAENPDHDTVSDVTDVAKELEAHLAILADLGGLYSAMVNNLDKKQVQKLIQDRKNYYSQLCEINLPFLDGRVSLFTNPLVAIEAKKLKSKLTVSCDVVKKWE